MNNLEQIIKMTADGSYETLIAILDSVGLLTETTGEMDEVVNRLDPMYEFEIREYEV